MNNQAFSKIWIAVTVVILLFGGIFAWQYLGVPKEEIRVPEEATIKELITHMTEFGDKEVFVKGKYSSSGLYRLGCWPMGTGENPEIKEEYKLYPSTWRICSEGEGCLGVDVIDENGVHASTFPNYQEDEDIELKGIARLTTVPDDCNLDIRFRSIYLEIKVKDIDITLKPLPKFLPETTNWKTYRNEKYGFELKYPQDSEVREGTRFAFDLSIHLPFTSGTKLTDKRMSMVIKENSTPEDCFGLTKWHGTTEVNGIEFRYIPGFKWEHAMGGKSFFASDYSTMKNNNCIGLAFRLGLSDPTGFVDPSVPIPPDPSEEDLDTEVFDEILSTFRFLE